jgi:hypothetical protein
VFFLLETSVSILQELKTLDFYEAYVFHAYI